MQKLIEINPQKNKLSKSKGKIFDLEMRLGKYRSLLIAENKTIRSMSFCSSHS